MSEYPTYQEEVKIQGSGNDNKKGWKSRFQKVAPWVVTFASAVAAIGGAFILDEKKQDKKQKNGVTFSVKMGWGRNQKKLPASTITPPASEVALQQ